MRRATLAAAGIVLAIPLVVSGWRVADRPGNGSDPSWDDAPVAAASTPESRDHMWPDWPGWWPVDTELADALAEGPSPAGWEGREHLYPWESCLQTYDEAEDAHTIACPDGWVVVL